MKHGFSFRRCGQPVLIVCFLLVLRDAAAKKGEAISQAERLRKEAERLRLGKEHEPALKLYQQVLALDPMNSKGHWGAGRIFLENMQPQDALPLLRRAVELARQSRVPPATQKKVSDAPLFSEVISDTAMGIMLLDLGVCLGETAHFSEQIAAFDESNRLRPAAGTFANLQRVRQFMCDW